MNIGFPTRLSLLAIAATGVLTLAGTTETLADSQSINANISSVTTTNANLQMNWSPVSGAHHYDVYYSLQPDVQLASATKYSTFYTTSFTRNMDPSLGYRYFRVYAYDRSNRLLAYSNLTGIAKYPSGLVVKMKHDPALAATYPNSTAWNYKRPTWFITVNDTVRNSYAAPHFKMGEFIKQAGLTSAIVDPKMVQHVQATRSRYGTVMQINSGYRTPAYNRQLEGSSTTSRHMYGDAVDFGAATFDLYTRIKSVVTPSVPSYIKPFSNRHLHSDWRNENKGYQN